MLSYGTTALIAVIGAAIAGFICFQLGISHRRKTAEAKIGSAEDEAKRLINDAIKTAEQKRKEALLEAKDDIVLLAKKEGLMAHANSILVRSENQKL